VHEHGGGPAGAISVSMPAGRYVPMQLPNLVRALRLAAAGVERTWHCRAGRDKFSLIFHIAEYTLLRGISALTVLA
jgi:hypothetical protein